MAKKKKKKNTAAAAASTSSSLTQANERQAKLPKVPRKGKQWDCVSLPKQFDRPSCTCMASILASSGQYNPNQCALHQHLIAMPLARCIPILTMHTITRSYERNHGVGSTDGLSNHDNSNAGALLELVKTHHSQTRLMPLDQVNAMIDQYAELLGSVHGTALTDSNKAEVLTRLGSLLLSVHRHEEARRAADLAIGLRPTLSAAYFIAGQSYFNAKSYDLAVDRFRAGLQEDSERTELKEAFRKALLAVNVARKREHVLRPFRTKGLSTLVRDDLEKPAWLKLQVQWKGGSSPMPRMDRREEAKAGEGEDNTGGGVTGSTKQSTEPTEQKVQHEQHEHHEHHEQKQKQEQEQKRKKDIG